MDFDFKKITRKDFQELLLRIQRAGRKSLCTFLKDNGFYTAPASAKYHLNHAGGLMQHSYLVYKLFSEKLERYKYDMDEESVLISALLHDICKINMYELDKESGVYVYKDNQLPIGHGEKSVIMIQKHIFLTDEEICCIRWHMGAYKVSDWRDFNKAVEMFQSVTLLHTADLEATKILEREKE